MTPITIPPCQVAPLRKLKTTGRRLMICPKCSFEQADGKKECAKRGGADPSGCAMEKLLQLPLLCDRRSEFPGAMNDRYDLNILVLTYDPMDGSVVTVYD